MAWVRFEQRFTFKPTPQSAVVYPPGDFNVARSCADAAVAAGKAVRLTRKNKDEPWQPVTSEN